MLKYMKTREVKSNLYPGGRKGENRVVAVIDEIVAEFATVEDLVAKFGERQVVTDCVNKRNEAAANEARIEALAKLGVVTKSAQHWKDQAMLMLTPQILGEILAAGRTIPQWVAETAAKLQAAEGSGDDDAVAK